VTCQHLGNHAIYSCDPENTDALKLNVKERYSQNVLMTISNPVSDGQKRLGEKLLTIALEMGGRHR